MVKRRTTVRKVANAKKTTKTMSARTLKARKAHVAKHVRTREVDVHNYDAGWYGFRFDLKRQPKPAAAGKAGKAAKTRKKR